MSHERADPAFDRELTLNLLALLPGQVPLSEWEIWAPHTWAPWLSMRVFRALLFILGAFLADRAWRSLLKRLKAAALKRDAVGGKDLEQRLDTLTVVGRRIASITLYVAASLMILGDFGIQVGPLLAGLGIVGVAVGFGAQYIVRDLINGFFLVAEDQFRVGDSVKVGDFSGTVETIALRTTRIRSLGGELHTVPNGEIKVVTNYSRHWSRAVVEAGVPRDADLGKVFAALREAGARARAHKDISALFLEDPEVVGVTELTDSGLRVRIWAKVAPGRQWEVERAIRLAIVEVFAQWGLQVPIPRCEVRFDGSALEALGRREDRP